MGLDTTKIHFYGPFKLEFLAVDDSEIEETGASGSGDALHLKYDGMKFDSATFSLNSKEGNIEFEDGSEKYWEEGRTLEVEVTLSEFDLSDMDQIETAKGLKFTFSETGKVLKVLGSTNGGGTAIVSVDNFKTKIFYRKFYPADTTLANCMTIA